ncbi:MAG TPA: SAM-dependent methyltransferase [Acidimicrobiales bacterium]
MPPDGAGSLLLRLNERIRRQGPLPFSAFMEACLYDERDGFYTSGRGAGRQRDFLTSPEVGPLFGEVVARALDERWARLGRPDPFVVIECGAGAGTLARDVLAAGPLCGPALRYLLVERSAALRDAQAAVVALELPTFVLGPTNAEDDPEGERVGERGRGPLAAGLAELPADPVTGVVLANELLDNLAFDLLQRAEPGWEEVRVGVEPAGPTRLIEPAGPTRLIEVPVPAAGHLSALADALAPDAPVGGRIPVQAEARRWLLAALGALSRGAVIAFDYADSTASLGSRPWTEWVRTYRGHGRGGRPLDDPGGQDVTCEVAVDQLAAVAVPTSVRRQAEWLADHGLAELADRARAEWQERAAVGDLAAVRARSRLGEAAALADESGLGAFTVLEWEVGSRGGAR